MAGFRIDAVPFLLEHTTPERAGLRKECPEIGWGRWTLLSAGSPHVLALRHHCRDSSVVTVHSFAPWPQAVRLRPGVEGGDRLVDLLEEGGSRARRSGAHHVALPAFGFRWYRVGGLNYALHRAPVERDPLNRSRRARGQALQGSGVPRPSRSLAPAVNPAERRRTGSSGRR